MRQFWKAGLAALLTLSLLAGCEMQETASGAPVETVSLPQGSSAAASEAEKPWEAFGVSEDFYAVTEDLAARFLALDSDGKRFDDALLAVGDYLHGTLTKEEAQAALLEASDACADLLAAEETVVLDGTLTEQLRSCGVSPEEYEAFANSRGIDLQSCQTSLSTLQLYLQNADTDENARENLQFFHSIHTRMQDSMRGYYYYGCLNYWFPSAGEAELACLQDVIVANIVSYLPQDAEWLDSAEAVEERVMACLDEVEAAQAELAQHVGQEQEELYELEQAAGEQQAAQEPAVSSAPSSTPSSVPEANASAGDEDAAQQALEEQEELLERLWEINDRIEALSAEIAAASEAGDEERLAELRVEFEKVVAEYEALTGEMSSGE